jgi:hypothetical protein
MTSALLPTAALSAGRNRGCCRVKWRRDASKGIDPRTGNRGGLVARALRDHLRALGAELSALRDAVLGNLIARTFPRLGGGSGHVREHIRNQRPRILLAQRRPAAVRNGAHPRRHDRLRVEFRRDRSDLETLARPSVLGPRVRDRFPRLFRHCSRVRRGSGRSDGTALSQSSPVAQRSLPHLRLRPPRHGRPLPGVRDKRTWGIIIGNVTT